MPRGGSKERAGAATRHPPQQVVTPVRQVVTPAQAGVQSLTQRLDSRLRGNDGSPPQGNGGSPRRENDRARLHGSARLYPFVAGC